ncbi:MAG TPA: adenylate/guanylate cyclase domain-containing protein [Stellaceae bacterium]|nr:adenylate/guanylate cyclase domain-containing protein [Stellaceae bacterium]
MRSSPAADPSASSVPAEEVRPDNGDAARAITDWLIRTGRFLPGNTALFPQFCERLADFGVPLDRATLHLRALHPDYRGVARIWKPGEPLAERFMDHGIEKTAIYLESPVRAVTEAKKRLEWRLDAGGLLPFALLDELRAEGYTHYVIAPFVYAAGMISAISWATRRPGGFDPAELDLLDDVLPALSTIVEQKQLRRFVRHMLTTYIGAEAGRLILEGQVRRGDVRALTAALMLVDLRDFSLMSDRMRPRAVIRMLNEYFDCVIPPVHAGGGEVVEIMGDGVLAIFRQRADGSACEAALTAATQGLAALAERNRTSPGEEVLMGGVALHFGTVSYGNIGVGERLDFTVIGPDVNLTSRIEHFCRELDCTIIMSEVFARRLGRPMWELGHFAIRGFGRMQRLFTLPPEE